MGLKHGEREVVRNERWKIRRDIIGGGEDDDDDELMRMHIEIKIKVRERERELVREGRKR